MTAGNPKIVLSEHARMQAARRGLNEDVVLDVARSPQQRLPVRRGRKVRQSRIAMSEGVYTVFGTSAYFAQRDRSFRAIVTDGGLLHGF